jgi:DNA helicase-2/ATP-dependent DNA helicase PcrA
MTSFTPTAEQQAIVSAATGSKTSLMIQAFAGCSKTTTLELVARALPSDLPILYIVFNLKNKKEAEARFPPNVVVKTINGLGHGAWAKAIGKRLTLDDRKLGKLVTAIAKERGFNPSTDQWSGIRELVTKAMQVGLVPSNYSQRGLVEDTQETWNDLADSCGVFEQVEVLTSIAREVLDASIKQGFSGIISFDDQIYLSVLFHGVFPRFPLVLVDEAQDQSMLNIKMISRTAADRLIVVGDDKQACYLWRGAAGDAMKQLRVLRAEWIDLPLATTFRCPKVVVARQQKHAPGFKAWEQCKDGEHIRFPKKPPQDAPDEQPHWIWTDVPNGGTAAVICRNNAPILSLAFKLLAQGTAVVMLGRDIGKGLVALSKKLLPRDDLQRDQCAALIEDWRNKEVAFANANGQERKAEGINDRADCLLAVLGSEGVQHSGDLRSKLEALFARENGKVTLSSIHRAKGLEWDTIVHLDPWRIPSKYAKRDPAQLVQEWNLKYVAETRTKHTLIEACLEDFQ